MIVVDIDMPKDCLLCPMYDGEYDRCQATKERTKSYEDNYAPNCPIKAVIPTHTGADKEDKEKILEAMSQFDKQTLAVAYAYASKLVYYGVDVTEKWETATQQSAYIERAYTEGYAEAMKRYGG